MGQGRLWAALGVWGAAWVGIAALDPVLTDVGMLAIGVAWNLAGLVLFVIVLFHRRPLRARWPLVASVPSLWIALALIAGSGPPEGDDWQILGEVRSPDGRYVAQYGKMGAMATGRDTWQVRLASARWPFRRFEFVSAYPDLLPAKDPFGGRAQGRAFVSKPPPAPVWRDGALVVTILDYWPEPGKDASTRKTSWRDVPIRYREVVSD